MITTRIQVKPHLAEYCYGKFDDVASNKSNNRIVRFPDKLDIYHTIYDLLERRPINVGIDVGNLELMLPVRCNGKDVNTFNYLGLRSISIIEDRIETMFWAEVHDLFMEEKHKHGRHYIDTAFLFLRKYNIVSITEDALVKNYWRWRNKIYQRESRRKYTRKQEKKIS